MNPLNSSLKKFDFSLKLNNLETNILNFLAESLEISTEQNKNKLITEIVKALSELNINEFEKFNNIINNLRFPPGHSEVTPRSLRGYSVTPVLRDFYYNHK